MSPRSGPRQGSDPRLKSVDPALATQSPFGAPESPFPEGHAAQKPDDSPLCWLIHLSSLALHRVPAASRRPSGPARVFHLAPTQPPDWAQIAVDLPAKKENHLSQTKISPNAQHVLHRLVNDRDDLVHEGRWSLVSRVGIMNPDGTTVPEDESVEMATVMELVAAGLIATQKPKSHLCQPNWAGGSPRNR